MYDLYDRTRGGESCNISRGYDRNYISVALLFAGNFRYPYEFVQCNNTDNVIILSTGMHTVYNFFELPIAGVWSLFVEYKKPL